MTDQQVKSRIIQESIASYPGNCPCPYNTARNGSRCGKRSAWSRPGGYSPICFETDEQMRWFGTGGNGTDKLNKKNETIWLITFVKSSARLSINRMNLIKKQNGKSYMGRYIYCNRTCIVTDYYQ